jgi:hypothetical protein
MHITFLGSHKSMHRFGKTISVSMFAAALMFACAGCEVSIYSTCKRISTKLLHNVSMFLGIIYDVLKCQHHRIIRANQEEVHLQGDEGYRDVRIIQSYPSKVEFFFQLFLQTLLICMKHCGLNARVYFLPLPLPPTSLHASLYMAPTCAQAVQSKCSGKREKTVMSKKHKNLHLPDGAGIHDDLALVLLTPELQLLAPVHADGRFGLRCLNDGLGPGDQSICDPGEMLHLHDTRCHHAPHARCNALDADCAWMLCEQSLYVLVDCIGVKRLDLLLERCWHQRREPVLTHPLGMECCDGWCFALVEDGYDVFCILLGQGHVHTLCWLVGEAEGAVLACGFKMRSLVESISSVYLLEHVCSLPGSNDFVTDSSS